MSSSRTDGPGANPSAANAGAESREEANGGGGGGRAEVLMPQMGISVAEGTILEWRKRPGDWVEADETVCDVTTDKVDVEIPAPVAGRMAQLLAEPGDSVACGEPIAAIDTGARPGDAHPDEQADAGADEPRAANGAAERDRSAFYSPVVRRIAAEHDVDLGQVEGRGVGGRVRKQDVLEFLRSRGGEQRERPLHTESPYRPETEDGGGGDERGSRVEAAPETAGGGGATPEPETAGGGAARREPMTPMRAQIARHMVASRRTAAHCTTIVEVDFSAVEADRAARREEMRRRGVRLTALAYVAEATVAALGRHPALNASVDGEDIVLHEDVNLGIAVALEDGLIVPVIRQAQRLSLEGLAAAIGDVAERARERRLVPDDVQGGTFTITNPGQFGAVLATPIINQPQVAILDLEAIVRRPVAVGDAIAVRPMAYLCMSWDHRALDGAVAARFLSDVREHLERREER